jgi:hypothetical protein
LRPRRSNPSIADAARRSVQAERTQTSGSEMATKAGPRLGTAMELGMRRTEVLEQFYAEARLYPESLHPGAKSVMQAVLEQGLAHVTDGSKPAYMGFEELKEDQQPDIAGALAHISVGRKLNPEFAVVTYRADPLCTQRDASFIINRANMRATIRAHAKDLGLSGEAGGIEAFLEDLVSGRSDAFKDEVKLGILLGLGAQNSRNYVERKRVMNQFETELRAEMGRSWQQIDEDEFNQKYNEKTSEVTAGLGSTTAGGTVAVKSYKMDVTMPRPWLGTLWDGEETDQLAEASLAETESIDGQMRTRHADRQREDAQASYADTLVEHVSSRLYLPET